MRLIFTLQCHNHNLYSNTKNKHYQSWSVTIYLWAFNEMNKLAWYLDRTWGIIFVGRIYRSLQCMSIVAANVHSFLSETCLVGDLVRNVLAGGFLEHVAGPARMMLVFQRAFPSW